MILTLALCLTTSCLYRANALHPNDIQTFTLHGITAHNVTYPSLPTSGHVAGKGKTCLHS